LQVRVQAVLLNIWSTRSFHLLTEIRADLTLALRTGKKPMLFSDAISWEPYIATLHDTSHESPPKNFPGLDTKLRYVWADLREFTRSANLAFQTGQKMDCVLLQEILVSVLYRLQLLHVNAGSPDEAIHVGMLAFSAMCSCECTVL
jgi:hypothetical protein